MKQSFEEDTIISYTDWKSQGYPVLSSKQTIRMDWKKLFKDYPETIQWFCLDCYRVFKLNVYGDHVPLCQCEDSLRIIKDLEEKYSTNLESCTQN